MASLKKIKICTWNCNSLKPRKQELECFLQINNIDICCLNETKFNLSQKINVTGFKILRNDRTSNGGGVAILIKNNISFTENVTNKNASFEYKTIDVHCERENLTLIAV